MMIIKQNNGDKTRRKDHKRTLALYICCIFRYVQDFWICVRDTYPCCFQSRRTCLYILLYTLLFLSKKSVSVLLAICRDTYTLLFLSKKSVSVLLAICRDTYTLLFLSKKSVSVLLAICRDTYTLLFLSKKSVSVLLAICRDTYTLLFSSKKSVSVLLAICRDTYTLLFLSKKSVSVLLAICRDTYTLLFSSKKSVSVLLAICRDTYTLLFSSKKGVSVLSGICQRHIYLAVFKQEECVCTFGYLSETHIPSCFPARRTCQYVWKIPSAWRNWKMPWKRWRQGKPLDQMESRDKRWNI